MASPVLSPADLAQPAYVRPTSVLLLRTPIPPSQGTDPYHDAFGPFCLPSFPLSALESGSSTPLPSSSAMSMSSLSTNGRSGADLLRSALNANKTGRRRNRVMEDDTSLTTHHLSPELDDAIGPNIDGTDAPPKREFCVTSVTILGHRLLNIDELCERLLRGSPHVDETGQRRAYRAAVITSQRAVEAWAEAACRLADGIRSGQAPRTTWSRVPIFAVGPATADALRALAKQLIQPLRTSLVMGGSACATAEALASYIIRHFNGPRGAAPGHEIDTDIDQTPVLYLTGDKNLSTLPDMLDAAQPPIYHDDLMVYETALHSAFPHSCTQLSQALPSLPVSRPGSRAGSRRSSRAGSAASSRRPSLGSWVGTSGSGTNSPLTSLAPLRKASRDSMHEDGAGGHSRKPGLTAMTALPPAQTAQNGDDHSAIVSSPIDEIELAPLDNDIGLGTGTGTKPDWIVFFSPSGVQYALDDLRARKWLPGPYTFDADKGEYAKDSPESKRRHDKWLSMGPPEGYPRIAALGPTTKKWIRQNLGFQPDAVAASPGPTELREAIRMGEKRIRRERERLKGEQQDSERLAKEAKARLVGVADGGGVPMEMD